MVTIRQILAVGMLLLLAGSHRLWTPQSLYPRVPLIESLTLLPPAIESAITWCSLALMIGSCLLLALPQSTGPRWVGMRIWVPILIASLIVQVGLDQHRLQPWAIHIALCLFLLDQHRESRSLDHLFWLTASIYIYSALSKFDAQFLHTVGQDFLHALGKFLQVDTVRLTETTRVMLAALFPAGELLCGLGLIFKLVRTPCAIMAILMHATLITILGLWGLNHSWGVLLWNALFIALNLRMMTYPVENRAAETAAVVSPGELSRNKRHTALAWTILPIAFVVPLGERFGWCDHWLGWALYAPHSSRAVVRVPESAIERLPRGLQQVPGRSEPDPLGWCELHLDNWSLATLGVPIYPQERFYVAVAEAATRNLEEFEVQTSLLGIADRWTGRRPQRQLSRRSELVKQTHRYRLNAVAQ